MCGRLVTTIALGVVALAAAPSAVAAQTPQAPQETATNDERLGFSRYLPEDVEAYVSVMQGGRVVRSVGESNAWKQLEQVPQFKEALAQMRASRKSPDMPPAFHMAFALLESSLESEVTVAVGHDFSTRMSALAKLGLLTAGGFALAGHEPDSPEGFKLAKKQAELRREWVKTVGTIELPSFVVAARVIEPQKYDFFVRTAISASRNAMLDQLGPFVSPDSRRSLEVAMAPVEFGNSTLWRFHLQLGDVLPASTVSEQLKNSSLDESERDATAEAIANLTFDVHLGFLGEYLTLVVSSDDSLMQQIAERYEGRSTKTLAASAAFEPIRAELTPDTIGLWYADLTAFQKEYKGSLVPLTRSLCDPELWSLLGHAPVIAKRIDRYRGQIESALLEAPNKQFSVLQFENGLRHIAHWEFEREPVARSRTPLTVLGAVPATSLGAYVRRDMTFDLLWDNYRGTMHEVVEFSDTLAEHSTGDPHAAKLANRFKAVLPDLLRLIDEKLAPSMRGEAALLLGPFVPFTVEIPANADVPKLSIPTGAVVIRSPSPNLAIEGFSGWINWMTTWSGSIDLAGEKYEHPVSMNAKVIDGIECHVFSYKGFSVKGLEPNIAKIGDWLVLSTSLELTKQIRDTVTGRAPAITSAAGYRAVAKDLPLTADELMYVDGKTLNRSIRGTVEELFSYFEEDAVKRNKPKNALEEIAATKGIVDLVAKLASTFRLAYGSVMAEGRTNVVRHWIRFEDIPPE